MKTTLFLFYLIIYHISVSLFDLKPQNKNIVYVLQPCPAYHEKTKPILIEFLNSKRFQNERKSIGVDSVALDEVLHLKNSVDKKACKELNFPRKTDDFLYTYYKNNNYYFIVNYFNSPTTKKKGNVIDIDTRSHSVAVYDQEFNRLGGVLF